MRKQRLFSAIMTIMLLSWCPAQTSAAETDIPGFLDGWNISGSNTLRPEWYATDGNKVNSIYQHRSFQTYDELDLQFSRNWSAYSNTRGRLFGVLNFSEYRRPEQGFTLERFNITHEKGDIAIPFRLEAGDYFGFFTRRTMQRSLKGIQLDFQPGFSMLGESHSLVMNAGSSLSDYRATEPINDDVYYGLSWLAGTKNTHLTLNWVNNFRDEDDATATPALRQNVYSIAADHAFSMISQNLTVTTEFSLFDGDIAGTNSNGKTKGLSDTGIFARVDGKNSTPLTYSVLYEAYGEDYRPNGASVAADRRSTEFRAGWAFESGLRLNGRYQMFRDGVESGNYTDTRTSGLSLTGPFRFINGANLGLNTFLSDIDNQDKTTNTRTFNSTVNFSMPLPGQWTGRSALLFTKTRDQKNNSVPTEVREASVAANHGLEFMDFRGGIDLGMLWRDTQSQSIDMGPNIGINLSSGNHRINAAYSLLTQDMETGNDGRLWTQSLAANYDYSTGPHAFRLEGKIDGRNSDQPGTRDYKIACSYRFSFNKKAYALRKKQVGMPAVSEKPIGEKIAAPPVVPSGPLNLTDFKPGKSMDETVSWASARKMGEGSRISDMRVYEYRYFDDIDQRQRFVLSGDGSRLETAAVIIDLDAAGNLDTVREVYHKVQATLTARYGTPETYTEGQFSPNLARDLNSGKFIMNSEWPVNGGIIRLGIPQRLNGQIRIEVQFSDSFPQPRDTFWSLEGIF